MKTMKPPFEKNFCELRLLFNYQGPTGHWCQMYKDSEGNFYYNNSFGTAVLTTYDHAKSEAWFEINRRQRPEPTEGQVKFWLL